MSGIYKRILTELKHHIAFTFFGASTGIAIMIIILYGNFLDQVAPQSENIFFILHPTHVFFKCTSYNNLVSKI